MIRAKYNPHYLFIMKRDEIIHNIKRTKSVEDFVDLLNRFKKEIYGENYHPYTKGLLYYYASASIPIEKLYHEVFIEKKSGKKRQLLIPRKHIKEIQKFIKNIIEAIYTPAEYVTGFVKGRSIIDAAKPHVGHDYIFCFDIQNFFPSIYASHIYYQLISRPYSFEENVAHLITNLCCVRINNHSKYRVLPQGAPTSPILSNIAFERYDKYLLEIAKEHSLTYTRYADDLFFSSNEDVFYYDWEKDIIFGEGCLRSIIPHRLPIRFRNTPPSIHVNPTKTRTLKKGQRQIVTGIIVNQKLNVKREFINDIRNILYIWKNYGYTSAQKRFNVFKEKQKCSSPDSALINVLRGKLNFMKQVRGSEDSLYKKFKKSYDNLSYYALNEKMISIKLKSGFTIKGKVVYFDLEDTIRIEIAGLVKSFPVSQIQEISDI